MKAIETVYNGYRFRSRLEARWAVFFDKVRIKYEYEGEGYERVDDDGKSYRYLPDFEIQDVGLCTYSQYLDAAFHHCDVCVEIKPDCHDVTVGDLLKWGPVIYSTNKLLLLCSGDPFSYNATLLSGSESLNNDLIGDGGMFSHVGNNLYISVVDWRFFNDENLGIQLPILMHYSGECNANLTRVMDKHFRYKMERHSRSIVDIAVQIARQARFEHGEKP